MDDRSNMLAGEQHQQSRPFLVGGSGPLRQSAAKVGGRRYIPKGGHVVDFTSRKTRKHIPNELSSTTFSMPPPPLSSSSAATTTSWAEKVAVRQTHDVLHISSPPHIDSQYSHALDGESSGDLVEDFSSCKPFLGGKINQSVHERPELKQQYTNPAATIRQKWRPPGPTTPHRKFNSSRRSAAPLSSAAAKQTHDCHTCQCCTELRQNYENAETTARQERAAAAHLRRRLEGESAKLAKERREFDEYKESEVSKMQSAVVDAARRRQRDRLAEGARERAATRECSTQGKLEMESLRAALESERREFGRLEGRHRLEMERLRRQVARLERENAELKAAIQSAESDRLQVWKEAQKLQKVVTHQKAAPRKIPSSNSGGIPAVAAARDERHLESISSGSTCSSESTSSDSSGVAVIKDSVPKKYDLSIKASCSSPQKAPQNAEDVGKDSRNTQGAAEAVAATAAALVAKKDVSATAAALVAKKDVSATAAATFLQISPLMSDKTRSSTAEVIRYPNGSVTHRWPDHHSCTTFINGDIKQEFPSGTSYCYFVFDIFRKKITFFRVSSSSSFFFQKIYKTGVVEYYFSEVDVWQRTHPSTGVETFHFPNGRVESHLPHNKGKETLQQPDGAGALKTLAGDAKMELQVPVAFLRKENLLPRRL